MIGSSNYPYSLHRQEILDKQSMAVNVDIMVVLPLVSRKSNLTVSLFFFVVSLNLENLPYILQ